MELMYKIKEHLNIIDSETSDKSFDILSDAIVILSVHDSYVDKIKDLNKLLHGRLVQIVTWPDDILKYNDVVYDLIKEEYKNCVMFLQYKDMFYYEKRDDRIDLYRKYVKQHKQYQGQIEHFLQKKIDKINRNK